MSILNLTSETLVASPASGQIEYNGQFFGTDSNASRAQMQRITLGSVQNSTSGTAITFSSIPAWVKRVTVMFNNVSSASTGYLLVQLGSGTISTSGYVSAGTTITNATPATASVTYGFLAGTHQIATNSHVGNMTLTLLGSNTWTCAVNTMDGTPSARNFFGSGSITLGGTLDQLRIIFSTTGLPVDTFDAGSINILYEG